MPDLSELTYTAQEPKEGDHMFLPRFAKVVDGRVFSGIMIDLTKVQAVAIGRHLPSGHHPHNPDRDYHLDFTLLGGATIRMDLGYLGHIQDTADYVRRVMEEIKQQIKKAKG